VAKIGIVKVDLHKNERDFGILNLSDVNVIKWLILYRDKIDLYFGEKTDNFYNHAGNVKDLNKELINLYVCLDDLITKCEFKEEQLALLKLLFMGYTFKDIEDATQKATSRTVKRRFESLCKAITEMNERLWKIYIHKNYLNSEFKNCTKCEQELPLTDYFYYKDKKGKDGYRSNCKKCTT
jgi:uncharacterized protein YerC